MQQLPHRARISVISEVAALASVVCVYHVMETAAQLSLLGLEIAVIGAF